MVVIGVGTLLTPVVGVVNGPTNFAATLDRLGTIGMIATAIAAVIVGAIVSSGARR